MSRAASPIRDRILSSIEVNEAGCWVWQKYTTPKGYGRIGRLRAHRVAFEVFRGTIPAGLEIDHLCRVRNCVNPDHLEPVTGRENIMRSDAPPAINARKTECDKGHPFDNQNARVRPNGRRACRRCDRDRKRHRRDSLLAQAA